MQMLPMLMGGASGGASGGFLQFLPMLAGLMGGGSGGYRGNRHRGGFKMPSLNSLINMGQQGYQTAQQVSPFLKPLLNQYGGKYGQQASGLLGSIGLGNGGKRSGGRYSRHRGGFKMPNLGKLMDMGKQGYQAAQQVSPFLKPLLNQYGGKYGQQASGLLGSIGLGKKGSDGRTARAQVVRSVMQERGVSLPQASRIVKEEGLY
jgi:hypothetical protein